MVVGEAGCVRACVCTGMFAVLCVSASLCAYVSFSAGWLVVVRERDKDARNFLPPTSPFHVDHNRQYHGTRGKTLSMRREPQNKEPRWGGQNSFQEKDGLLLWVRRSTFNVPCSTFNVSNFYPIHALRAIQTTSNTNNNHSSSNNNNNSHSIRE